MVSERLKRFWKKFKNWLGKNEEKMEDEESTPIFEEDRPLTEFFKDSEDLLNRKFFAEDLAEVLLKHLKHFSPCSFSIGIYGKWGSGKTSLLNMVLKFVKDKSKYQDPKPIIVQFNPWLCSDWQQMISQFFKQLAYEIKLKRPKEKAVWETIAEYGDMFEFANLIPTVGPILAALGKVTTLYVRSKIKKIDNSLQKQKDKIIDSLTKKSLKDDLKIIVTIDDIDRLTKEEIIAVFQLVKNLADFPNTVYLLAFDYDIVVKALEEVQGGDGREYLEKVIQVPFQIPAPNMETIHNVFVKKIEKIIGKAPYEGENRNVWRELFQYGIKPYIKSLRDVNRFANVFYLKYKLLAEETNVLDLIGLTCLQVFEPNLYKGLPAQKKLLNGSISTPDDYAVDIKNELTNFVQSAAIDKQESVKWILGFLFPVVKRAFSLNIAGTISDERVLLFCKKIAAKTCFNRYFSLTLEENNIPSSLIERMIMEMSAEELAEQIKMLGINGKTNQFVNNSIAFIGFKQSNLSEERAAIIIKSIIRHWAQIALYKDDYLIFGLPLLFEMLLNAFEVAKRFEFLSNLFHDPESNLSALAHLLDALEEPFGLNFRKIAEPDKQLISLEEVQTLERTFVERAECAFDDWINGNYCDSLKYLWKLEKLDTDFKPEDKIDRSKNVVLVSIINSCIDIVRSIDNLKCRELDLDSFTRLIPFDILKNDVVSCMESYVKSEEFFTLPNEFQMNTVAFLLFFRDYHAVVIEKDAVFEEEVIKVLKNLEEERQTNDRL